jgi:hypothetical protein
MALNIPHENCCFRSINAIQIQPMEIEAIGRDSAVSMLKSSLRVEERVVRADERFSRANFMNGTFDYPNHREAVDESPLSAIFKPRGLARLSLNRRRCELSKCSKRRQKQGHQRDIPIRLR